MVICVKIMRSTNTVVPVKMSKVLFKFAGPFLRCSYAYKCSYQFRPAVIKLGGVQLSISKIYEKSTYFLTV